MRGCHQCEHAGKQGDNWESSACAKCADPGFSDKNTQYDLVSYAEEFADNNFPGAEEDQAGHWVAALSSCVMSLVDLNTQHPETFKYCMEKLRQPSLSYQDIAEKFGCKKQNVDYHLKRACQLVPALKVAFLVDPRFNCGHAA